MRGLEQLMQDKATDVPKEGEGRGVKEVEKRGCEGLRRGRVRVGVGDLEQLKQDQATDMPKVARGG